MRYLAFLLAVFFAIGAANAGEKANVSFWPLTAEEERAVKSRQAVVRVEPDGSSEGIVHGAIDINASPAQVWRVMLDCARATKFVEGLTHCDVLKVDADGSGDVRRHIIQWAWFLPEMESVIRSMYVRERSIAFRKVSGSFSKLEGAWTLEPLPGEKTRVRYEARVGIPVFVPNSIVVAALQQDLPRTLSALRDEVEGNR